MKSIVVAAVAALALAGCATQQTAMSDADKAKAAAAAKAKAKASSDALALAKKRLAGVESAVYFDFDKFDIKKQYHGTISAYGNYLSLDKAAKVRIEGNADERGTVEYNLALGNRRAEAVSIGLQALGADGGRIETVSNGEEKPRNTAKTEAAYAENRRADLIIYK
jgi:peptidoglycan-associated lipoprotein